MTFLDAVTPVILTFNEAPNIGRTLERLAWARDIVVVDSGSTDETLAIAAGDSRVRLFSRPFDSHSGQWRYAMRETSVATEWVLALDADYVLSDGFVEELARLEPPDHVSGYRARFVYCVHGRPLRAALYPPVTVVFRHRRATYEQDGHTQRVRTGGEVLPLRGRIFHDDRKPLGRWLLSQDRYMEQEAEKILRSRWSDLGWADRLRKTRIVAPPAAALWCLFAKGLVLGGRPGLCYTLQRVAAEMILSMKLLERDLSGPGRNS